MFLEHISTAFTDNFRSDITSFLILHTVDKFKFASELISLVAACLPSKSYRNANNANFRSFQKLGPLVLESSGCEAVLLYLPSRKDLQGPVLCVFSLNMTTLLSNQAVKDLTCFINSKHPGSIPSTTFETGSSFHFSAQNGNGVSQGWH